MAFCTENPAYPVSKEDVMAKIQYSFKRFEKKFLLSKEQFEKLLPCLREWVSEDEYGKHTVGNIYFDTDTYELIRASIEKPPYKEKFRLRSYGTPDRDDYIFAEIKKKFDGVVYKRRVAATQEEIHDFLNGSQIIHEDEQIQREIRWFFQTHTITPKVFIAYERIAFVGKGEANLRITFDQNIRWRTEDLDFGFGDMGQPVLSDDRIVMEVKVPQAFPLWLAAMLSKHQIYTTSFSKYGTCYSRHLATNIV